ncbi:MAG: glyoxalase [Labilithrix sp.]|nr:glyoxalase [Labilithrix sp.]
MHHSRFASVIIDCKTGDVHEAARFWSAAFGRGPRKEPQESGKYVPLEMRRDEPIVEIQAVTHESRVHLDIETDDVEAEVKRLVALGATEVERIKTWVVMQAPTGQKFCVIRPQTPDFPANANRWE